MTTEVNHQKSETGIERASRAIKEAEQAYQEATAAPHKLRRSYEAELETIQKTLDDLKFDAPVEEVERLLIRCQALERLIQASEKNSRPSRDSIDEAWRRRDDVIRLYHQLVDRRAAIETDLEYRQVVADYAAGRGITIPYLWFRKRRTNSRQPESYLRQMIEQEIKSAAQNGNHYNEQNLIKARELLQAINQQMEELGGDRLKTERLNDSYRSAPTASAGPREDLRAKYH